MMPPFRTLIVGNRRPRDTPLLAVEFDAAVDSMRVAAHDDAYVVGNCARAATQRRSTPERPMLTIALAGTFAASLAAPLRAELATPGEFIVADEAAIVDKLADVDVLVTMAFTRAMGMAGW